MPSHVPVEPAQLSPRQTVAQMTRRLTDTQAGPRGPHGALRRDHWPRGSSLVHPTQPGHTTRREAEGLREPFARPATHSHSPLLQRTPTPLLHAHLVQVAPTSARKRRVCGFQQHLLCFRQSLTGREGAKSSCTRVRECYRQQGAAACPAPAPETGAGRTLVADRGAPAHADPGSAHAAPHLHEWAPERARRVCGACSESTCPPCRQLLRLQP